MIRTQISLTHRQYEYLLERKRVSGESISSSIRRALEFLRRLEPSEHPGEPSSALEPEEVGREKAVG